MAHHPNLLTVKQAAEALGLSIRTLRRRIAEGDLSAQKIPKGARELTAIDGAELARYAQATGLTMAAPQGDDGNARAEGADTSAPEGRSVALAQERTGAAIGQGAEDGGRSAMLMARVAELEGQARAMTQERDWLRGHVDSLARALPAAREETDGLRTEMDELRRRDEYHRALAEWQALSWWQRRKIPRPTIDRGDGGEVDGARG